MSRSWVVAEVVPPPNDDLRGCAVAIASIHARPRKCSYAPVLVCLTVLDTMNGSLLFVQIEYVKLR